MGLTPTAEIDLAALRHNLGVARQTAPGRKLMAVIKANGYGHGLERVARALAAGESPADAFAVARIDEARRLRAAGIRIPIVLLEGCLSFPDLNEAAHLELGLVIHRPEQIDQLSGFRPARPLSCWLKVDTGMHRLGFAPEQAGPAYRSLAALDQVAPAPGLMTHLANADDRGDPSTERQLSRFAALAERIEAETSIANSAGILAWPASHGDWVRPGLMLYGASPLREVSAGELGLRPVMSLSSSLIAIQELRAGDPVGYGGTWRAPRDGRIGVVGIGYGDGYPREVDASASVLLHGRRAPIVGRVSMDMLTVDLNGLPQAAVGDRVLLWGEGLPIDGVADAAGTIAYTLLCGVAARVDAVETGASQSSDTLQHRA